MNDRLTWAIAIIPNQVSLLSKLAHNLEWMEYPLLQRWMNWHTRQHLTDDEYLALENYLRSCLDRATTLHLENNNHAKKNS